MILGTELQLTAEFLDVWSAVGSSPGHFDRKLARERSLGSAVYWAFVFESHAFAVNLSPLGLKIQPVHTKYVKSMGYVLSPEVIATDSFSFELTVIPHLSCFHRAMHQLYPGESRGAKVTATQQLSTSTSTAPSRPSATHATSARKTTIPGTLHQPLTPRTSTTQSTPRPCGPPPSRPPPCPGNRNWEQWRAFTAIP